MNRLVLRNLSTCWFTNTGVGKSRLKIIKDNTTINK